jgi:two-component system sensor kinase FixL
LSCLLFKGYCLTNLLKNLSFQMLFDAAADAMLLIDTSALIIAANPIARKLLAYDGAEIVGLKITALLPLRYQAPYLCKFNEFCANPQLQTMASELIALCHDDKELLLNIKLSPLQTGQQLYLLATFNLADRRSKITEALRASEERLRLAKQAAGLGVFDFDSNHNIMHWDERMRELWGAESNKLVSYKRFITAIHPEDRAIRLAALNSAIDPQGNGEYNAEYRVVNPIDATERWVATVGRMHFKDGNATRLVGVARDITAQKNLEKKLQDQRSESETLFTQQVAAQTVSAIAHELNQPLAAISAYSEVALHELKSDHIDPDNLKHALEGCVAQAQRAGSSLHELLALLQKGQLDTESIDFNLIIKEALNITKSYGYHGFNPILQLEQDMPAIVGNRIQIVKVLVNLLRNAMEAMRAAKTSQPTITIIVKTNQDKKWHIPQWKIVDQASTPTTHNRFLSPFSQAKAVASAWDWQSVAR